MFLLYHSVGCNIRGMVFHECYANDLHTTTSIGVLGHHTHTDPGFYQVTAWYQTWFQSVVMARTNLACALLICIKVCDGML